MEVNTAQSRWDRLHHRFKNSWTGIALLALTAGFVFLSQIVDMTKKVVEFFKPVPHAGLTIQSLPVKPLDMFSDLVSAATADTVYPGGATVSADFRHDRRSDETISIRSLHVNVDAHDPAGACPYTLSSDHIHGAGSNPVKMFIVHLDNGKVDAVERKEALRGPVRRGRSADLLALDPPMSLTLSKSDDVEAIAVRFIVADAGRYKVRLSATYTRGNGLATTPIASLSMCLPRE